MNGVEQQEVLRNMEILVDSREQPTKRAKKRYERFGCPHRWCTLSYDDYSYDAVLPDGRHIYDISETVSPACVIERKMSLDELAACFCRGRKRLIVENANWENLLNGRYQTKMDAKAFVASLVASGMIWGLFSAKKRPLC